MDLISVVIFAYNHEKYIARTIESVIEQKCSYGFKIYICDDCSTDGTAAIIMDYYRRYSDLIIPVLNETNIGLNNFFHKVIKTLSSRYLAILGGDDYWIRDDKLYLQVKMMEENEEISYVHTEYISYVEKNNKFQKHQNANWKWLIKANTPEEKLSRFLSHKWKNYPLASSCCCRLSILLEGLNKYSEILLNPFVAGEGTIIHTSMCYLGNKYAFLPVETTIYTIRENSLSHKADKKEQFYFHLRYADLRFYIANIFSLKFKIYTRIIDQVLCDAVKLNQKKIFKEWIGAADIPAFIKQKYISLLHYKWINYSIKLFFIKQKSYLGKYFKR